MTDNFKDKECIRIPVQVKHTKKHPRISFLSERVHDFWI